MPAILLVCFTLLLTTVATAQDTTRNPVSPAGRSVQDTMRRAEDTTIQLSASQDSVASDTAKNLSLQQRLGIIISPDALPHAVTATARDSAVLDIRRHIFQLYGDAGVKYDDMKLEAGQLIYYQNTGTIQAFSPPDSTSDTAAAKRPAFAQGSEQFSYDTLQYNFNTKRAIVRNARTQYGEGYIRSEQIKRNPDQSIFGLRSLYTTCALDTPHFGIRTRRIKVIPGKVAVSGAANLEIEGVPTPLFLPFGLFPVSSGQRSGFRLPTYTLEGARGLGLTGGGYYFHFSDYIDLLAQANIFSKGSWAVSGITNYSNRYHYSGVLSLSYAYNKTGEVYEAGSSIAKDFLVTWAHQTDAKARPGVAFNASVTAGTSSFFANNSYNTNQILQNQYQSNIAFSKNWVGKPYSLTVAALHNQNTGTRQVNVTLPQVTFYVSQFNPLQGRHLGAPRWYEKITSSYSFNAIALTTFYDTSFHLKNLALSDFRTGIRQAVPISASYTIARFINFSTGINYNEYWLQERLFQSLDTAIQEVDTVRQRGFFTNRDFNATAQLTTRIYGIKLFKKGTVAGIRHVITPNVGINYTPDFSASPFNNYYETVLTPGGNLEYRSPYEASPIGMPGLGQFGNYASTLNFGLNNNLQMKVRANNKDTGGAATKNVTLIDAFGIGSAYNLAADSFNWSPVSLNFRTSILSLINVHADASWDLYAYDHVAGRRSQRTAYAANSGLARFEHASIGFQSGFHSKDHSGNNSQSARTDEVTQQLAGGYNDYIDFNIPWTVNLSYLLNADKVYRSTENRGDTLRLTQNVLVSGDFNLTPRWKLTFSSGYDFTTKALTLTSIDIYRDLHCWEMRLGTIPFGTRKSYNFSLNVKAAVLQDLRLLRRRDYRDAIR